MEIALVGATGLVGEALLDLLPGAGLPFHRVHPLASEASAGRRVDYGKRHIAVGDVTHFDFTRVSHAVFAVPRAVAAVHVPRATSAGCVVVDASTAWSADAPDPPFDVGRVLETLAGGVGRSVFSLPGPLATVAAEVLAPLRRLAPLESVDLVGFRAASDRGRAGISALARETADLLNARPRQETPFAQQLAFNLIPGSGEAGDDGCLPDEAVVAAQLGRLLGEPALPITATLVEAPVFFGAAAVVTVVTRESLPIATVREALARTSELTLADPDAEGLYPAPVTHSAGSDDLFVARVRSLRGGRGLVLWVLADNIRRGMARTALRVLTALVRGGR